jgi:hypothetical protein
MRLIASPHNQVYRSVVGQEEAVAGLAGNPGQSCTGQRTPVQRPEDESVRPVAGWVDAVGVQPAGAMVCHAGVTRRCQEAFT